MVGPLRFFILLSTCFSGVGLYAQKADAVLTKDVADFREAPTDSARLAVLDTMVRHIWKAGAPTAYMAWTDTLLRLALATKDTARMRAAYALKGEHLSRTGEFVKLEVVTRKSLALVDPEKEPRTYITMLMHASYATAQRGDPDLALERLLVALRYADREGVLPGTKAMLKYSLGRAYVERGEPAKAIPYFRESIVWSRSKPHLPSIAQNLNYLGRAHHALGELDSALMEQLEGIAIVRSMDDRMELARQLVELGSLYTDRHELKDARTSFMEAVLLSDSARSNDERTRARLGLAKLDLLQGRNALPMLLKAEMIADSIGLYPELREIELMLTRVYAERGESVRALAASQRVVALGDTLFNIGKRQALLALSMRYETDQKDKAIVVLRQEKEIQAIKEEEQRTRILRQQQFMLGAALIGSLLLLTSVFAYRAFRIKRKAATELELKNAEVLRQKERAEENERAKDRFLANVSHEVRTPLNAIMGFTGLLMHEVKDERSTRFLGNIRDAGDNLLSVINDVLDLSRIEAGRLHLVKEPFDLHRCLHLCAEILQHRANEQRDELLVDLHDDAPQWVLGDSARLTQILLNLTGNALKFTTNGTVTITAAPSSDGITLRVSDTGIGIPKDKLGTVFERFTQVHDSDQRVHGGAGLGLSIVKELVELYNGSMQVESEPGQGTTFTVELPLKETEAPADARQHFRKPDDAALDGRTVLVAEDNDMNALVTEETLARFFPNARIRRVRDGDEVLACMGGNNDVALILMDVQMPKRDGISATRAIRAMGGEARNTPIIALTASVLPNDLSRCMDAGMDACVSKPFKADELLAAIARLTGSQVPVSAEPMHQGDLLTALFKRMVPERLKTLKEARAQGDRIKMLRVVHSLRPQLMNHDEARFSASCTALLNMDPDAPPADWDERFDRFTLSLQQALAQLP